MNEGKMNRPTCVQVKAPGPGSTEIQKWKVSVGKRVYINTVLATYVDVVEGLESGVAEVKKLKSDVVGVVEEVYAREGHVMPAGSLLMSIESCRHPTLMKDLCAECGADLRITENKPEIDPHAIDEDQPQQSTSASISMVHSVPELRISEEEAKRLGKADQLRLLKNNKLALIVDLDQTVIHTTVDPVPPNMKDVFHFQLWHKGPDGPWYHTRLRPGVRQFLEKISKYYELHVFTFGARLYAHTIAGFLDEEKKYFSHRILSRDECFDPFSKTSNLKSLFPCGDKLVCIIDDREDIWNYASNLIRVKPYNFFHGTGDINAPPHHELKDDFLDDCLDGQTPSPDSTIGLGLNAGLPQEAVSSTTGNNSVLEDSMFTDLDESFLALVERKSAGNEMKPHDEDDYLYYLEDVLIRIHRSFYSAFDDLNKDNEHHDESDPFLPDLKLIIPHERSQVLQGVNILFSGVIPTNIPPERCREYQIAKALGATVCNTLIRKDPHAPTNRMATTHVIASKPGTAKVNFASRLGNVFILTPEWLWCCAERWESVDERLFPLDLSLENKGGSSDSRPSSPDLKHSKHRKRHGHRHRKKHKPSPLSIEPEQFGSSREKSRKRRRDCYDPIHPGLDGIGEVQSYTPSSGTSASNGSGSPNAMILTQEELLQMDKEVEDTLNEKEDSDLNSSTSSDELKTAKTAKRTRFDTDSDVDDLLAAALEREFMN